MVLFRLSKKMGDGLSSISDMSGVVSGDVAGGEMSITDPSEDDGGESRYMSAPVSTDDKERSLAIL